MVKGWNPTRPGVEATPAYEDGIVYVYVWGGGMSVQLGYVCSSPHFLNVFVQEPVFSSYNPY